ncbi:beta strand repeat-containing protein [Flagellimonas marinaquae]|uniref:beta strand repeat-containing protein n=1 Tax=Flagellimonas marinaquae TaxID=254955 RepID=UPI0020756B65|nr:hypothetical protein [Allomuricauda aquimarina]USD25749.1 hypothetical protein MJO53_02360 [Allomuricauda aquimarina]
MKTSIVYTIIALLMINTLSGQVKIGNNPESLDPASVLELESNTRVLVITRVTDAQMSVINPLPGALAYNTDQDCLHYYDGTQWVNICEELDNSFTVSTRADYLSQLNPQARDSTVIITTTVNPDDSVNYNFEVAQITGANIVNTSINGASKLQDDSVTSAKLADGSVTLEKLADATTGQPGDLFQWNGINWTLINESALGITEKDSIVGNEVVGPTDATLLLSGTGSQTDPLTLDVAALGIDTAELADDAVTTTKIADGNVTDAKLDKTNIPLSGFGAAGAAINLGNQIIFNLGDPTNPLDAVNLQTLNAAILASNQTIVSADAGNSISESGTDGGAFYDDTTIQNGITTNTTAIAANDADILQNQNDIANNTTAIGTKEDVANKSNDGTLADNSATDYPTEQAVKTYVDNEITASNQTIVSADAGNSISESGTDGGAFYDDTTIQNGITTNTTAIAANDADILQNQNDIANNTTAIGTKEDVANKSNDGTLADNSATDYPTEQAVKTYVDNEITASNQTIVSADAGNSISESGTDGGAFYDDTTIQNGITTNTTAIAANDADILQNQNDIANNTTAIGTKEDVANKSNDGTLADNSATDYPTEQAVKTYVDNITEEIANAVQVNATDGAAGLYNITDGTVDSNSIIQLTVQENTSGNPIMIQLVNQTLGNFSVQIYEFVSPGFAPTANNANWQYIVINP